MKDTRAASCSNSARSEGAHEGRIEPGLPSDVRDAVSVQQPALFGTNRTAPACSYGSSAPMARLLRVARIRICISSPGRPGTRRGVEDDKAVLNEEGCGECLLPYPGGRRATDPAPRRWHLWTVIACSMPRCPPSSWACRASRPRDRGRGPPICTGISSPLADATTTGGRR